MVLTYRLEIRGRLPRVARGAAPAVRRGRGAVTGSRTVVSGITVDQAALRAVLSLLWDVGSEVHLVRAMSPSGEGTGESSHDEATEP